MKPLLLLDIDGVINAFGILGEDSTKYDFDQGVQTSNGAVFRIRVPPGTQTRVQRLSQSFEMVWATMWMEDAHPCIGLPLLGIKECWPYVRFDGCINNWPREVPRYEPDRKTFKLAYVADYVGDRSMAWVDDDIQLDAAQWAEQRRERKIPTLLVRPQCHTGLTDSHVASLVRWARSLEHDE